MQKFITKYFQSPGTHQKDYPPWSSRLHPGDARTIQYALTNKCNSSHKQIEGQKPHDLLTRCRKTFDKIQYPFVIKRTGELRDTRDIPQYSKDHLQQADSQRHLKWRETQSISTKIRNELRLSTLLMSTQYSAWILSYRSKAAEGYQLGKGESKYLYFQIKWFYT